MNRPPEREQLLMRYLDGPLSGVESRELSAWLREDAAARAWLRELAEQAVALGDLGREKFWRAPVAEVPPPHGNRPASPRLARATWLALAASVVLLAGAVSLWLGGRFAASRAIVEVEEVTGILNWTGPDGEWRGGLAAGVRLPAGILETDGEGATALVRFADGTRFTLRGNTQLAISDDGQKRASLLSGRIEADVAPQPKARPLLVRTPTATLEVLGTAFSVTASPDQTTMNVEQGRVRLQRLADGQTVDVPANHTVTASLETAAPLVIRPTALPPTLWRADFGRPPAAGAKYEWLPAAEGEPALARAVPLVVGNRQDGGPLIQYGVSVRDDTRRPGGSFVAVGPRSVLRLRYRLQRPALLALFFVTQRPHGGFGGNFELTLPADAGVPDGDGWRVLEVPLSEFRPLQPRLATSPAGNAISHLSVKTLHPAPALRVAELVIEPEQIR
jgi:ferric-dicitrate binding protein FerR (iron transport regulator)